MTRRRALLAAILFLAGELLAAQAGGGPVVLAVWPTFDIPLPLDQLLFQPSGGATVEARYAFPKARLLSVGPALTWRLGRMQHADLGSLGTLSVISAEVTAEIRSNFRSPVDLFLSGGIGWFYAVRNSDPAQRAANLELSARAGIGFRVLPPVSLDLGVEYRRYQSLYHTIGVGVGAGLRLPAW